MLAFGKTGCGASRCNGGVNHFRMAKSLSCSLSYENSATSGAMLAFSKACFRAGCCYGCINNLCMTQRGFFLICGVITLRTGHVSVPTDFGTSGSFCFMIHFIVTKRIDLCLCYGYGVTNGAVLTFGKTGCRTSGCNGCVSHFGMTKRGCYRLLYGYSATGRAMLAFCQTGFGTGGCFGSIRYFGMSGCGNILLCYKNRITSGAMLTLGLALFRTSGGNSGVNHFRVTECGFFLICRIVTLGASYVSIPSNFRTSGSLCVVAHLSVSGGLGFSCLFLGAGAGACFFACLGASGSFGFCPIAPVMTGSFNCFCFYLTASAGACFFACCGTSGGFGNRPFRPAMLMLAASHKCYTNKRQQCE